MEVVEINENSSSSDEIVITCVKTPEKRKSLDSTATSSPVLKERNSLSNTQKINLNTSSSKPKNNINSNVSTPRNNSSSNVSTPKNSSSKVTPKSAKSIAKLTPKTSPPSKDLMLPTQRIKMIMKSCPEVEMVPHESLYLITRATELFIQFLATESYETSTSSARLDYDALSSVVHSANYLDFLKETIPRKITWAECQRIMAEKEAEMENFM